MKKKCIKCVCAVISLGVFFAGLYRLGFLTENKLSYNKTSEFVATGAEYDVLFLGTSHMAMGVHPMELWQDYGITSYNLAGNGHPMPASYWVMMNAFDYASPGLVVIDCYNLQIDSKAPSNGKFTHESFDAFPLSVNKFKAIWDLFDNMDEREEYLWNFATYHYRWSDLGQDDFQAEYGNGKGAYYTEIVDVPEKVRRIDQKAEAEFNSTGVLYLEKMIEECKRRNVDVLLTYMPFPAQEEDQLAAKYVNDIALQYNVNYINFLETNVVNYNVDCYDPDSHLNASGARKVTEYLGDYIQAEYEIADHRGEAGYDKWNQDYLNYSAYKIERLQSKESLKNYLMLLADKNYSYCVWVKNDTGIWNDDSQYRELLTNLTLGKTLNKLSDSIKHQKDYFVVVDNGAGKVWECTGDEELKNIETSFGTLTYLSEIENTQLYWDEDEEDYIIEQYEDGGTPKIQIIVFDNADGRLADVARFGSNYVKK